LRTNYNTFNFVCQVFNEKNFLSDKKNFRPTKIGRKYMRRPTKVADSIYRYNLWSQIVYRLSRAVTAKVAQKTESVVCSIVDSFEVFGGG
jgi:hypothetical protein